MRLKGFIIIAMGIALQVSAQGIQKQRFGQPATADYPLMMHVTRSFVSVDGGSVYLHLLGVIDGQNVEMASVVPSSYTYTGLLRPGGYPARGTGQITEKDGSLIEQYDLQLANGQHKVFTVIGLSE